jgi:hypothetical protein
LQELSFYKQRHKAEQAHQLWPEGSHPQQLSMDNMVWQELAYMHNKPLRRGYVDEPIHWRYSSARNYVGLPGLLDVYMTGPDARGRASRAVRTQAEPGHE